ncbi:flagellar hook-length control protein FliK [Bacillus sp. DJP31]|uniref:flagellar hook-length control protein FliK n=1 Tax=Bacillus sp. DJP31 TaxID=3409789 RepID=UPI003BB5087E
MNVAGIQMQNKVNDFASKSTEKQGTRPSFPFASLLNNEVQQAASMHSEMTKLEDVKTALMNIFTKFSSQAENEPLQEGDLVQGDIRLEEMEEMLQQLLLEDALPATLNEEILGTEQLSWIQLLPQDLVNKLKGLLEEEIEIEDLLTTEDGVHPVENLLAGLIFFQQAVQPSDQSLSTGSKESLLSFFQYVNTQLQQANQLVSQQAQLNQQSLPKELESFLSSIHAKLTGQNSIATHSEDKLDYLKSLFQMTFRVDDGSKDQPLQDTSNKVAFSGVENQSPLSRVQQFTLFVDQSGSKAVNQEQFIKEFQNLLSRSSFQNANGGMKLLIKLYPEQLGQLRIEILQQQGVVTARLVATTAAAKEMLESQLQGLKNAFASQNIQVEKLEIINAGSLQQEFERSLNKESNHQQSSNRDEKEEDKENKSNSFEATFQEELMNLEV